MPRFLKPVLFTWTVVRQTGKLIAADHTAVTGTTGDTAPAKTWRFLEDWILTTKMSDLFRELGASEDESRKILRLINVLTFYRDRWDNEVFFKDDDVRALLGVNLHEGTLWLHKESGEELLYWLFLASLVDIETTAPTPSVEESVTRRFNVIQRIRTAMEKSGYRFEQLLLDIPKIFG